MPHAQASSRKSLIASRPGLAVLAQFIRECARFVATGIPRQFKIAAALDALLLSGQREELWLEKRVLPIPL